MEKVEWPGYREKIHEDWLQLKMPYVHMAQRQKSMMANDDTLMIYRKKVA